MNLPDITLIIQMFNFMIAFFVLRKFIFAPAFLILENKKIVNLQLQNKITTTEEKYRSLLVQQTQRWRFIQKSLIDMMPDGYQKICFRTLKLSTPIDVHDSKLSDKDKEDVENMLIKNLSDI